MAAPTPRSVGTSRCCPASRPRRADNVVVPTANSRESVTVTFAALALLLAGCGDGAGEAAPRAKKEREGEALGRPVAREARPPTAPEAGELKGTSGPVRRPVRAGQFYPADPDELRGKVRGYIDAAEKVKLPGKLIALIGPHAGYVYSGPVAGWAYRQLEGLDVDTAVLVGGHSDALDYGAVMTSGAYLTPLGEAKVDYPLARRMVEAGGALRDDYRKHAEPDHALEVHVPFIQVVLPKAGIVPVYFNRKDPALAARVGEGIARAMRGGRAVICCSTDLSHYPPAEIAEKSDKAILEAVCTLDSQKILDTDRALLAKYRGRNLQCSACCLGSVLATVEAAKRLGATGAKVLRYEHSGDRVHKDRSRVVGYGAIAIYGGEIMPQDSDRMLTDEERETLLALARRSVETKFEGEGLPRPERMTPALETKAGAFVTLHKGGRLRGCIGTFERSKPLWEVVGEFARSAAFHDSRFPRVRKDEVPELEFEISVLSPLKKIDDPLDIRLGIDGIWLVGSRGERGTYLPQVATETGWSKEEFLSSCASSKAFMEPDAWRDPKRCTVHTYTAEVFSEGEH